MGAVVVMSGSDWIGGALCAECCILSDVRITCVILAVFLLSK